MNLLTTKIAIPIGFFIAGLLVCISQWFIGIYVILFGFIFLYLSYSPVSYKSWIGISFMFLAGLLSLGQLGFGWFNAILPNEATKMQFGFIIIILYALSIAFMRDRVEDNFKYFLYGLLVALIPSIIISSVCAGLDFSGLTSTGALGFSFPPLWGLSQIASMAQDLALIVQVIVGAVPAGIAVVGAVMVFYAGTGDEQAKAFVEAISAGVVVFVIALLFSLINVHIFG
jgi:hypothetical protein